MSVSKGFPNIVMLPDTESLHLQAKWLERQEERDGLLAHHWQPLNRITFLNPKQVTFCNQKGNNSLQAGQTPPKSFSCSHEREMKTQVSCAQSQATFKVIAKKKQTKTHTTNTPQHIDSSKIKTNCSSMKSHERRRKLKGHRGKVRKQELRTV